MPRDLTCVHRAADLAEADIVVAWLAEQGVAAMVKDRYAVGTLQVSQIVAPRGIEVCVVDPSQADRARGVIGEHFAERCRAKKEAMHSGTVDATCEDCGRSSTFPARQRGTVQTCPHCRAYIDVPPPPSPER